jgi:thiol-disulfide isomerase/thioredoxin
MNDRNRRRRAVVAAVASGWVGVLSGCSSRGADRGGQEEQLERAAGASGTGTPTTTAEVSTGSSDDLVLPSLDVAGSPGGLVPLRPEGKAVLLDFFATWCPPCEPEMDNLRAVRDRYDRADVFIVSVTQETDESAIESFWTDNQGTWPVVMDPSTRAARAYDATSIPTIVVLAADRTEVARHTGLVGEQPLAEALEEALGRDGS